jgi:hypothetical protein
VVAGEDSLRLTLAIRSRRVHLAGCVSNLAAEAVRGKHGLPLELLSLIQELLSQTVDRSIFCYFQSKNDI